MLAGLGRSLLLAGGGVTGGLAIVAAVYGPGDLVQSVRSKLSLEPPAITAPDKPEWGERNRDLGRELTPPDPGAAPPADRQAGLPSLDIVRVEPSGEAVIAGRGAPNASVEILRDNKPYASGLADETGQFAIVPPALPVGNSELTYRTTGPDGQPVMGRENVVVVVPETPNTRPLVAVGTPDRPTEVLSQPGAPGDLAVAEPGKRDVPSPAARPEGETAAAKSDAAKSDTAKSDAAKSDSAKSDAAKAAAKPDVAKPDVAKPNLATPNLAKPPERVAALPQAAPKPGAPDKKADLKIVSVDAQEGGRLDIAGRAGASSTVRLYLNDTLVATGRAGSDGRIAFTIGRGVSPGGYQIRIDQVDPGSGRVAHRAQVAFAFPDSATTAPLAPQAGAKPASVPPPIPERATAETAAKPGETAARVAAAPPSAPALEARAAARQPDPPPKPPASAAPPPRTAEAGARPKEPLPPEARPEPRPSARLAEAPSGLTTTWVQPPRQPAAETPAAAGPEPSRPMTESGRRPAEALAPTPAEPEPRQAMAPLPATPAPDTRAGTDASRPEHGLSVLPPGPATAESGQPGAVFVPEISTARITRGDSLWVISKRTYGRGLRYTVIFDANQDQIKDPDLIYPGQIFVLPKDAPLGDPGAKRG